MKVHCLENVGKSLGFLREQRVHLENMGSYDIVDGNPRLTLGLIWTIILRFQVDNILLLISTLSHAPKHFHQIKTIKFCNRADPNRYLYRNYKASRYLAVFLEGGKAVRTWQNWGTHTSCEETKTWPLDMSFCPDNLPWIPNSQSIQFS